MSNSKLVSGHSSLGFFGYRRKEDRQVGTWHQASCGQTWVLSRKERSPGHDLKHARSRQVLPGSNSHQVHPETEVFCGGLAYW